MMVPVLFALLAFGVEDQVVDVDFLAMNDEMRAFVDEHVTSHSDTRKLQELVEAIFSEDFLNLVYDNTRTKTAAETFESRNGNCLSFTTMFVAMARYAGLRANFQEVFILPTWNRKGETVVLNRHINVAVRLNGGLPHEVDFNPFRDRKEASKRLISDQSALAQFYNNLGAEAFATQDRKLAVRWFEKAVMTDANSSFIWSNMGVAFRYMQDYERAEQAYLQAIRLNKREYTAMTNLSALYRLTDRPKAAERWTKKAEHFRRQNPYYHYGKGIYAFQDGNFKDAAQHFKRAIRRKRDDHQFHFDLAKAYVMLEEVSKAEDSLARAKKFAPDVFNENRYSQKLEALAAYH